MLVRGVDGCRGGWLAVDVALGQVVRWQWVGLDATDALVHDPLVRAVGVDVPIGLPDAGPRACDREARVLLGRRGVSVFPAPLRPVLATASYAEARRLLASRGGPSMSAQAFGIVRAVAAMDDCLSRADDWRVFECHPEVAFCLLGGGPGLPGKRTDDGAAVRRALLAGWLPDVAAALAARPPRTPENDALDALACAWSAVRWVRGQARVLTDGGRDARGLPMRIVG